MKHKQILSNIREKARQVLPQHSRLVLFGSQARGDAGAESDWDLLVLLDQDKVRPEDFDRYAFPFVDLGWSLGEYFSPKLYTFNDWNARHGTPFYKNVTKDGIELQWN